MSLLLYLIIGPVLWCVYTAWAARHFDIGSYWHPIADEFVVGLVLSPIFWPIGLLVGLVCALSSWLYDLLTP